MDHTISDEQWYGYFREGYLKLGQVLGKNDLAVLQERIDDIMLGKAPVDYSRMLMQLDSETGVYSDAPRETRGFKEPTLSYRKIQDLEYDPLFLQYLQHPIFREICGEVYGCHNGVSCFRAMFMNKPALRGTELPWHQDGGKQWHLDRDPLVTVWTALDPSRADNGCVQIIPGSHRLGLLSDWGHTISKEQEAEHCPPEKVLDLELEPGEVVLLHNWLLHRSGVNTTGQSRRAFSVCYTDARTRSILTDSTFPVVFGSGALTPAAVSVAAEIS